MIFIIKEFINGEIFALNIGGSIRRGKYVGGKLVGGKLVGGKCFGGICDISVPFLHMCLEELTQPFKTFPLIFSHFKLFLVFRTIRMIRMADVLLFESGFMWVCLIEKGRIVFRFFRFLLNVLLLLLLMLLRMNVFLD